MHAIVKRPVWTEAREQRIAELWSTQMTARMIAADIGGFENAPDGGRCAVLGKAHRMGLPERRQRMVAELKERAKRVRYAKDVARNRKKRAAERGDEPIARPAPEPVAPWSGSLNIPFADLEWFRHTEQNQCRFIEPGDSGPEYLACGNSTDAGGSYCSHHRGIVYVKRPASANPSPAEGLRCL